MKVLWQSGQWPRRIPIRSLSASNHELGTNEAKVGCVFTQTRLDEEKRPVRDDGSATYVGAIEKAEPFGWRIYSEALRRGLRRAEQVIVLGDGAPWIWGIAAEHFPSAVQIVDLYHAREHLAQISKVVYGEGTVTAKCWAAARSKQLDAGHVGAVVRALKKLHPRGSQARHAVVKRSHISRPTRIGCATPNSTVRVSSWDRG